MKGGEALQVLRYQPFGHYHAHFDGQDGDVHTTKTICCHQADEPDPNTCKLCRYAPFNIHEMVSYGSKLFLSKALLRNNPYFRKIVSMVTLCIIFMI